LPDEDQVANKPLPVSSRTSSKFSTSVIWAKTTVSILVRQPRVFIPTIVAALAILVFLFMIVPNRTPHPPSADALSWYNVGTRALHEGGYYGASKALERAVAADDGFALAHARLAEAYIELDNADKAKDEILRARSLVPEPS